MTINRIVAIDFGCLTAVACVITRETYNQLAPRDFYDCCTFIEVEPTQEGLDTLLKLANERTLFVGEPTGPYSGVWVENLRCAGYQVRLIAHDILASFRTAGCGWRDKDDQHDAVAIGYYAWQHLDRPGAFNKIKTSHISEILELYLYKEKLNVRIGALTNQLRQMIHSEFPESLLKRSKSEDQGKNTPKALKETEKGEAPPLIKFVAGLPLTTRSQNKFTKLLAKSIGSASSGREGKFSLETIEMALDICKLMPERHQIKREIGDAIHNVRYRKYNQAFDQLGLGLDAKAMVLTQIYPFENFLSPDGKPVVHVKTQSKKSASGKYPKKKVSERMFHAALGMAPSQRSSGRMKGQIVGGSALCRRALWRWATMAIVMWKSTTALKNDLGHHLRERYVADMGEGSVLAQRVADILTEDLTGVELIGLMRRALVKHPMGPGLVNALEGIMEENKKRTTKNSLNKETKKVLSNLARSRICGTAVKLLFKELLKSFKDEGP